MMLIRFRWLVGIVVSVLLLASGILLVEGQRTPPTPAPPLRPPAPQAVQAKSTTAARPSAQSLRLPIYQEWKTYTKKDGLPSDHFFCVRMDGNRVWAGSDQGLVLYENGKWRTFSEKDGIPHRVVHSIDVSPRTGDVWFGTFRGLGCYSAGRITKYTQFNSGLPNNVVYAVKCVDDEVWVASTAGAGRYNLKTKTWTIYNEKNTPMHEIWCYQLGYNPDRKKNYVCAWGGGVLEYDRATDHWKVYADPDGELEVDLLPNDGIVHDIVTDVEYDAGLMWVSSYFGLSRYDYHRWWTYTQDTCGLPSDFINIIRADGPLCWACTDKGLGVTNGEEWAVYRPVEGSKQGEMLHYKGKQLLERRVSPTSTGHKYTFGVDVRGNEVWVATAEGLSHSVAAGTW